MVLTPSNMLPLGTKAPDFTLPNPKTGEQCHLSDLTGKNGTVIMFISNHCPYVIHIEQGIKDVANTYIDRGIHFIAIGANNVLTHPADGPDKIAEKDYPFPYLYDESQAVAKAYDAACTPDIYMFDQENRCIYRGQFDAARPNNGIAVSGEDLRYALDCLLAQKPLDKEQKPSIGCNIKWKEQ